MTNLKIGKFNGVNVSIHISTILFIAILSTTGLFPYLLAAYFCITLHEYGHIIMARLYGIETRDIVIFPFGGMAFLSKNPESYEGEIFISAAGPIINLIIGIILGFVQAIFVHQFIFNLMIINFGLFLFNLLPLYPNDGGRIVRGILWPWVGYYPSILYAATVSLVLCLIGIIVSVSYGLIMLPIVLCFLLLEAKNQRFGALQAMAYLKRAGGEN